MPKRYNLILSDKMYDDLEKVAKEEGATKRDILFRCIKLGLLAVWLQESGGALIIKEGDVEKRLLML